MPFYWPSSPGQTPVTLRVPSAAPTVDRRLDQAEDPTLQRGGEQDLAPASVGIGSLGSIVFTEGNLPDLPEDGPGEHPPSTPASIPAGLSSALIIVSPAARSLLDAR
jgi:hypothetical protein